MKYKGEIFISRRLVELNTIGWSVFDFFENELHRQIGNLSASSTWFAFKLQGDTYRFKWAHLSFMPTEIQLSFLHNNGWGTSKEFEDLITKRLTDKISNHDGK